MKQFSLDEYLANPSRKVVTRDGRNVRIKCTDRKSGYPIIGLVTTRDYDAEDVIAYTRDGEYLKGISSAYDLFFASEKHEGWVNIYRDSNIGYTYAGTVFDSPEEAERAAQQKIGSYVTTIKIEWEE